MSAPVIIGFANYSGDALDSSKFSGQFTPFLRDKSLDAAAFPVGVALDVVDKWFHRARIWSLSTDAKVSGGGGSVAFVQGVQAPSACDAAGTPMASEKDHAAVGAAVLCNAVPDIVPASGYTISGLLAISLFRSTGYAVPAIYYNGTDYFPAIGIGANLSLDNGTNAGQLELSSDPASFSPATGSIDATIDGVTVPLYYKFTSNGTGAMTLTHFDLTIASYWPYNAKDGTPIYDVTNGLQLQDPRVDLLPKGD